MSNVRWKAALMAILTVAGTSILWRPQSQLTILRRGGKEPPTFVLLHGYASSAEHWVPFTRTISFPGRILLPQAPDKIIRADGLPEGRAWWNLDLNEHSQTGNDGLDQQMENPLGLDRAARKVRSMLSAEGNSAAFPFLLGGFSQGAMVSCQIAFASDEPLAALVILSGTPINEQAWQKQMIRRKRLPVFISHGRKDTILSFSLAEHLSREMKAAGLDVTFFPFDGGHEIPTEVVTALNNFLARIKTD